MANKSSVKVSAVDFYGTAAMIRSKDSLKRQVDPDAERHDPETDDEERGTKLYSSRRVAYGLPPMYMNRATVHTADVSIVHRVCNITSMYTISSVNIDHSFANVISGSSEGGVGAMVVRQKQTFSRTVHQGPIPRRKGIRHRVLPRKGGEQDWIHRIHNCGPEGVDLEVLEVRCLPELGILFSNEQCEIGARGVQGVGRYVLPRVSDFEVCQEFWL